MTLSIIIPNYNKAKYLRKCLESVYLQTYQPDEVIVVDDCSVDESVLILEEVKESHPELVILPLKRNGGVSNARNIGVQYAKSEYITFLDSDDYYYNPKKLENEMMLIKKFGEKVVAYSYTVKVAEDESLIRNRMASYRYPEGNVKNKLIANYRFCSGMPRDYCLSKKLFLEAGGYTIGKNLYEDLELTIKLSKVGGILKNTRSSGTAYRAVANGLSTQKRALLDASLKETLKKYYKMENWYNKRCIDLLRGLSVFQRCIERLEKAIGIDSEER